MSEPLVSPRSADEPMAFSKDEVWAGGGWAWLAFNILLVTVMSIVSIWSEVAAASNGSTGMGVGTVVFVVFYTLLIGGAVALCVMLIGLPGAWFVGRRLRRVASVPTHVVVHGTLGALLGVIVFGVYVVTIGQGRVLDALDTPLLSVTVALTSVSVVFGWWMASRRARSERRIDGPRSPLGLDEAFGSDASLR